MENHISKKRYKNIINHPNILLNIAYNVNKFHRHFVHLLFHWNSVYNAYLSLCSCFSATNTHNLKKEQVINYLWWSEDNGQFLPFKLSYKMILLLTNCMILNRHMIKGGIVKWTFVGALPIFDNFTYYVCLFCSHIVVNIMKFDATVIQVRGLAISYKPGLIHHFLQQKMPVSSQEYDSCYLFVWCIWAFDFAIWLGTFRFEFSSEFSILLILLFPTVR